MQFLYNLQIPSSDDDYILIFAADCGRIASRTWDEKSEALLGKHEDYEEDKSGVVEFSGHEVRSFCELLLKGNPRNVELLFCPEHAQVYVSPLWRQLTAQAMSFISQRSIDQYFQFIDVNMVKSRRERDGASRAGWRAVFLRCQLTCTPGHNHAQTQVLCCLRLKLRALEAKNKRRAHSARRAKFLYYVLLKLEELEERVLEGKPPQVLCVEPLRSQIIRMRHGPWPDPINLQQITMDSETRIKSAARRAEIMKATLREEADVNVLLRWLAQVRGFEYDNIDKGFV